MPGLPEGVGMYYDMRPEYDDCHCRVIINETAKIKHEFTQLYNFAISSGDRESKIKANDSRFLLEEKRDEIIESKSKFPRELQERIATQIEIIQSALDRHPKFDIQPAVVPPAITYGPHNLPPPLDRNNFPPLLPNLNPIARNFLGPRLPQPVVNFPSVVNHNSRHTMNSNTPVTTPAPTAVNLSLVTTSRPILQLPTVQQVQQIQQTSWQVIRYPAEHPPQQRESIDLPDTTVTRTDQHDRVNNASHLQRNDINAEANSTKSREEQHADDMRDYELALEKKRRNIEEYHVINGECGNLFRRIRSYSEENLAGAVGGQNEQTRDDTERVGRHEQTRRWVEGQNNYADSVVTVTNSSFLSLPPLNKDKRPQHSNHPNPPNQESVTRPRESLPPRQTINPPSGNRPESRNTHLSSVSETTTVPPAYANQRKNNNRQTISGNHTPAFGDDINHSQSPIPNQYLTQTHNTNQTTNRHITPVSCADNNPIYQPTPVRTDNTTHMREQSHRRVQINKQNQMYNQNPQTHFQPIPSQDQTCFFPDTQNMEGIYQYNPTNTQYSNQGHSNNHSGHVHYSCHISSQQSNQHNDSYQTYNPIPTTYHNPKFQLPKPFDNKPPPTNMPPKQNISSSSFSPQVKNDNVTNAQSTPDVETEKRQRNEDNNSVGTNKPASPAVSDSNVVIDLNPHDGNKGNIGKYGDPNHKPGNDITNTLMVLCAAKNSREYLINNRLPLDQRFSGDDSVDFESTLLRFQTITEQSGINDREAIYELKHYFVKDAAIICELYEGKGDPKIMLQKAISHLKREYGYQARSVQGMIDKVLTGGPIDRNNPGEFKELRIKLTAIHGKAKHTGRESTFNTSDTINKIIREKIPFINARWAVERTKKLTEMTPENF